MTACELWSMIPQTEIDRVFQGTASAELAIDFLAFEKCYKFASMLVPETWIILDLGCGYAAQAYYFTNHKKYIAVDCYSEIDCFRFQTDNMEFFNMSIQKFLSTHHFVDLEHVFAICSAVPDEEAQELTVEIFPNHYVWYPGGIEDFRFEVEL